MNEEGSPVADKDTEVRKNDGGGINSEVPFSQNQDRPRLQPVSNNLASTDSHSNFIFTIKALFWLATRSLTYN